MNATQRICAIDRAIDTSGLADLWTGAIDLRQAMRDGDRAQRDHANAVMARLEARRSRLRVQLLSLSSSMKVTHEHQQK